MHPSTALMIQHSFHFHVPFTWFGLCRVVNFLNPCIALSSKTPSPSSLAPSLPLPSLTPFPKHPKHPHQFPPSHPSQPYHHHHSLLTYTYTRATTHYIHLTLILKPFCTLMPPHLIPLISLLIPVSPLLYSFFSHHARKNRARRSANASDASNSRTRRASKPPETPESERAKRQG